jgi:hypothetical protein
MTIGLAAVIGRPDLVGSLFLALQSKKARQEATAGQFRNMDIDKHKPLRRRSARDHRSTERHSFHNRAQRGEALRVHRMEEAA